MFAFTNVFVNVLEVNVQINRDYNHHIFNFVQGCDVHVDTAIHGGDVHGEYHILDCMNIGKWKLLNHILGYMNIDT